jgi:Protein of unknown function (DUF3738)
MRLNFTRDAALSARPHRPWARATMALTILVGVMSVHAVQAQTAQSAAPGTPKFEVPSVKPCKARGGRGGGGASQGRLRENCVTVMDLIRQAYVEYANGRQNPLSSVPIEGGPGWINSDPYEIDATAEGAPGFSMMRGPMLQALLEDRFNLKIRRESREVLVYTLTVSKGGPKLQPRIPEAAFLWTIVFPHPILSFAECPNAEILDCTWIAGMFDIQLPGPGALNPGAPSRREVMPASSDPAAPVAASDPSSSFEAIKTAVQKLGLKLEPAKGPGEFLVIDRVEKPSGN